MRIIKKLACMLLTSIIIFSGMGMFQNKSKAVTYLINETNLYSKGELVSFVYKENIKVGVQFVVYKKDGVEYPAYCLNRNLIGVTENQGVKVTVNKALSNSAVWRAVTNGYPFKTPAELKCNSNIEAFAATKMAVYDALYTYNWNDFTPLNDQGKRVLAAAEKISKRARSSKETKINGKVEINSLTETWKMDEISKEYISKTYKVVTNVESTRYQIKLDGFDIDNVKLTDKNNNEKSEFSSDETFKVLIPVSELENKADVNKKFTITATANLKTKPVLYGETVRSDYQDYALAAGEWEFESTILNSSYPSNKTMIKIVKKDKETEGVLKGAKFNILDKNKNVIYSDVSTNEEGVAEVKGIMPGKYFIEETQAPEGYTKYDELVEVNVKFNETYTINVNNYKRPETEEKQIDDEENVTVTGKKEIALPRTGF